MTRIIDSYLVEVGETTWVVKDIEYQRGEPQTWCDPGGGPQVMFRHCHAEGDPLELDPFRGNWQKFPTLKRLYAEIQDRLLSLFED